MHRFHHDTSGHHALQHHLYVDYMSQPSRACALLCRATGLSPGHVTEVPVLIHKGETRGAAHLARTALGKVPLLEELPLAAISSSSSTTSSASASASMSAPSSTAGSAGLLGGSAPTFRLPESAAIMTYLASAYKVPGHWYPASLKARAQVDAALHWYHSSIRAGCARLMWNRVIAQRLGQAGDPHIAQEGLNLLKQALPQLEAFWLRGGGGGAGSTAGASPGASISGGLEGPFVAGQRQPSVADLLIACELEQLTMLNKAQHGVDMAELLAPHPRIRAWMAAVAAATAPHYELVHATLRKAAGPGGGRSPALDLPSAKL